MTDTKVANGRREENAAAATLLVSENDLLELGANDQ